MNEFLTTLLQAVIIAAVPVVAGYIVKGIKTLGQYLASRTENETAKVYLKEAALAISTAVSHTSQTYVDALKKSNNREADIKAALEGLRKESGYLFEERREPPPPYAAGPGTAPAAGGKYDQRMAAIRAAAGLKND